MPLRVSLWSFERVVWAVGEGEEAAGVTDGVFLAESGIGVVDVGGGVAVVDVAEVRLVGGVVVVGGRDASGPGAGFEFAAWGVGVVDAFACGVLFEGELASWVVVPAGLGGLTLRAVVGDHVGALAVAVVAIGDVGGVVALDFG